MSFELTLITFHLSRVGPESRRRAAVLETAAELKLHVDQGPGDTFIVSVPSAMDAFLLGCETQRRLQEEVRTW